MAHGHLTLHQVAEAIGINARTLQRRLASQDLTYRQLVDDVRLEAACELLRCRGMTVSNVAHVLGYSDPAHFTRAFGRMTGMTPRDFQVEARKSAAE